MTSEGTCEPSSCPACEAGMTSQWSCIWNCALGPENQRAAVAAAGVEKGEDRGAVTDRKALAKAIGALGLAMSYCWRGSIGCGGQLGISQRARRGRQSGSGHLPHGAIHKSWVSTRSAAAQWTLRTKGLCLLLSSEIQLQNSLRRTVPHIISDRMTRLPHRGDQHAV